MICGICGTKNEDGATACQKCGGILSAAVPAAPVAAEASTNNRKRLIIFAAIGLAVVIALIAIIAAGSGGYTSPEKVGKVYINAFFDGDGKKIVGLVHDKALDVVMENKDLSKRELIEQLDDRLESATETVEKSFGKWTGSYKVTDTTNLNETMLTSLQSAYQKKYKLEVEDAVYLTMEATFKKNGEKKTRPMRLLIIKIDDAWYIETNISGL